MLRSHLSDFSDHEELHNF